MNRLLGILLLGLLLAAVGAGLLFAVGELSSGVLLIPEEVPAALSWSLEDQKKLARLDPEQSAEYRTHFESLQTLLRRLEILESNRAALRSRFEMAMTTLMMLAVLSVVGFIVWRQRRLDRRLNKIRAALGELAEGRTDVRISLRGFDVTARIAGMIERTSRVMAADRQRLAGLRNLSAWQEAARRHAHEMKTPLTGARLEVSRLMELAKRRQGSGDPEELAQLGRSALREIDRLSAFSRDLTSFARLRSPQLERQDLGLYVTDFCRAFEGAWENLELVNQVPHDHVPIDLDRNMIRQVLANLCDNSSHASAPAMEGKSQVRFCLAPAQDHPLPVTILWVSDEGAGIDPAVRSTLFAPYTTTKSIGSGMGLGLAICRKILLDHGGDLEVAFTGPTGTTFQLIFPAAGSIEESNPTEPEDPRHDRSLDS